MKTLFTMGFAAQSMWSGQVLKGPSLGVALTAAEIDGYMSKIKNGRAKLAQVRAWIAARIDADPMLARTFSDAVVQKNFWDFMDQIDRDQWYVDQTWEGLQNPTSPDYDTPEENLARTDEWAQIIGTLVAATQQYGGTVPRVVRMGPDGRPLPAGTPGAVVKPGTPVKESTILGIKTNDLLLGASVAVGVGALLYALS